MVHEEIFGLVSKTYLTHEILGTARDESLKSTKERKRFLWKFCQKQILSNVAKKNARIQTKYRLLKFDILTQSNQMIYPSKPNLFTFRVFAVQTIASTEQGHYKITKQ